MSTESFHSEEFESTNYRHILSKYLSYWYLFVLGVVLSLGAAVLYLRYATPQYNISSLLLIKDKRNETEINPTEKFTDFSRLNAGKNVDNEIVLLKSVSLMHRVLSELSLQATYRVKGGIRQQEVYQDQIPFKLLISHLDSAAYGQSVTVHITSNNSFELEDKTQRSTHQFGQILRKPYGTFTLVSLPAVRGTRRTQPVTITFQNPQKLANHYAKSLRVVPVNKQASVLSLSLTDAVPARGKDIINKLVEVYNKEAVEDKNATATNTINFIDGRLQGLSSELTDVEKEDENFKRKNQVADVSSQVTQSLREAGEYSKQISNYGIQIEVLESIENYITQSENQQQLIPGTLNVEDATLASLIAQYNDLQLDRDRMLRTTEASHPVVQNMNDQLANLRQNIQENLRTVKNNLTITRRNLLAKNSQFGSRIQQVPTIERGILAINRQQELKRALYLYLLQKREEAALSLAATVSNSRIVDRAIAEDYPVSPNKTTVLLVALLVGLGLPLAFVYVKELMNDKVQLLQDVQWVTTAPILGELIHDRTNEAIVVANQTPIAEMFRLIRINLQFAAREQDNKVLLVTSSMSGEGKTFFSLNLGASLVLTGKKVVIVGLDLRKPNAITNQPLTDSPGITDYLVSDAVSVDDIVKPSTALPGLYVVDSGPTVANPSELMLSPKVDKLIDILKESFDYVLIDSAPVGQVADAFSLAPYIDSTIYLVRYNFTHKAQLEIINRIQAGHKLKQVMLVVNDANKANLRDYGYGNGYGYYKPDTRKQRQNLV
ncbi:GumC family protein [Hymenobacter fodinae]|uniref:non-specific protein-tyrosine kinase n=1 Tax=Hymenobacter fodinae TaxID=2510796 RepID=A0A4Z0P150_9BACT|nr:tyrosine-protein kinase [Hymenobacter fodinae]TGE04318.1 polysaccharide biosynthesis tyrosine autokinase [Hymenobacter fodinae]